MSAVAEDIHSFLASQPRSRKRRVPDTFLGLDTLTRGGIANTVGTFVAAELALDRKTFARLLHISPATLDRRNESRADFKGAEADALYKLLAVAGAARRVLKTPENVRSWIRRAQPGLGGRVPLELARTSAGADAVRLLLDQIYYGIVP